jgi:hypothetical protein
MEANAWANIHHGAPAVPSPVASFPVGDTYLASAGGSVVDGAVVVVVVVVVVGSNDRRSAGCSAVAGPEIRTSAAPAAAVDTIDAVISAATMARRRSTLTTPSIARAASCSSRRWNGRASSELVDMRMFILIE